MTCPQPVNYEYITGADRLLAAVQHIAGCDSIAVDTESNSRYHYPEQLCLIQIGAGDKVYIIDTILLPDISPLQPVLEDYSIQKIIHGADYDIRCLDRHYGYRVRNLYDTSVAARFTGETEFGLAALIKNLLNVTIPKSEKIQQSNWGRRPLSLEALEYAAADVIYLLALRDILDQRLAHLTRAEWVAEECARLEEVRFNAPDVETAFLYLKGGQELDGNGLAVLRSLYLFREEESLRQGRPPYFVIPDKTLIQLAANPRAELTRVPGLGPIGLQRFGHGLRKALHEGQTAPAIRRPVQNNGRLNPVQVNRLKKLKVWRTGLSEQLSLDPSLLWPTVSLERLAKAPENFTTETGAEGIRRWQRDQFARSLQECLKDLF